MTSSNSAAPIDMMVKAQGPDAVRLRGDRARRDGDRDVHDRGDDRRRRRRPSSARARTVDVAAGSFSDDFAANAVHIYQIDLAAATCR